MACTPDIGHRAATVTFQWREHGKRLAEGLANMFRRGCQVDTDVVLPASEQSQGQSLRVHCLVLSVFLSSKVDHENGTSKLDLNDVAESVDDIRALVDFVYTGRLTVRTDQVESIRRLAKALNFEDLFNTLDMDNVNELLYQQQQQQQASIDSNEKSTTLSSIIDESERRVSDYKRPLISTNDTSSQSVKQGPSTDEHGNVNEDDDDDDKNSNASECVQRDVLQCPLCPSIDTSANFGAKEDLRNHFIIAHPEDKLFVCHQCDFNTLSDVELELHVAAHDADNVGARTVSSFVVDKDDDEPDRHHFQCPLCPKSFRTYLKLEHHAKRKHCKSPPAAQSVINVVTKPVEEHNEQEQLAIKDQDEVPELPEVKTKAAFVACAKLSPQDVKLATHECESIQMNEISDQPVKIPFVSREGLRNIKQTRQTTIAAKIKRKTMVTCQLCQKMFTSLAFLKYHTRLKHKTELPEEVEPSVGSAAVVDDKEEGDYDHNGDVTDDNIDYERVDNVKLFFCKWCSKAFKKKISVIFHARQKHKIRPAKERFLCHVCNMSFTRRFTLKSHMRYNHKKNDKVCLDAHNDTGDECDEPASTVENGVQGTDKKQEFCCTLCPLSFNLSSSLKRHRTVVHRNIVKSERFQCQHCPRNFLRRALLNFHLKMKHKLYGKHLPCPKCTRKFSLACHLAKHLKYHHSTKKESKTTDTKTTTTTTTTITNRPRLMNWRRCNTCRLKFDNVAEFHHHLYAKHADKKIYECSRCHFLTISKNSLYLHLRRHNSGNRFQCDNCDHSFTFKSNLIRHRQKAHSTAIKEHFTCSFCSMVLKTKRGLNCHITRRHRNEVIGGAKSMTTSDDSEVEMAKLEDQSGDPMDNSGDTEETTTLLEANDESDAPKAHDATIEEDRASSSTCSFHGSDGHAEEHGGDGSGSVSCDANFNHRCLMCSFRSDADESLRLHVSSDHPDIKIFQCSRCPFWTIQERRMKAHWCRNNSRSKKKPRIAFE